MQFQTTVPEAFEEKMRTVLSSAIGEKAITLYRKINTDDVVAGRVITDGLINLFDLDFVTQEKVVNALELFSRRNIFLAAYFLKRVDVLERYGVLDEMILFLQDLMEYSGRKASYSLYKIDDALVQTTTEYIRSLLQTAHAYMPQLEWSSGVAVEQAQVLFEKFGPAKPIEIMRLGAELFSHRPVVLQYYFDWSAKLFTDLTMIQARSLFSGMAREPSDEILRNQVYALSQLSKEEIDKTLRQKNNKQRLSDKQLRKLRLKTLATDAYINAFSYPQVSNDLYFSAIFRRWHVFTKPTKANILHALSQHNFHDFFRNTPQVKKISADITKRYSASWDDKNWIYIGSVMTQATIMELIDSIFRDKGKHFSVKPTLIRRQLRKEFHEISRSQFSSRTIKRIVSTAKKYTTDDEIRTVLDACLCYLDGNAKEFVSLYSTLSVVAKIWDRDPWVDMARSDELFSCTFIGDYGDHSAPLYLYDNSLTFMDFFLNGRRKGRAYMVIAVDEKDRECLFVDIFEGSNTLLRGKKRFEFIIRAMAEYAKSLHLENIVFNGLIYYNDTPRFFIELLKKSNFGKPYYQIIRKKLAPEAMNATAPFPKPPFLNSFKSSMTTLADGIIIDVKKFCGGRLAVYST